MKCSHVKMCCSGDMSIIILLFHTSVKICYIRWLCSLIHVLLPQSSSACLLFSHFSFTDLIILSRLNNYVWRHSRRHSSIYDSFFKCSRNIAYFKSSIWIILWWFKKRKLRECSLVVCIRNISLPSSRCHHSYSTKIGCWELMRYRAEPGAEHRNMMLWRLSESVIVMMC